MIEVEHLTKTYAGVQRGVYDLTFSVAEGEIVGLLGPNGAGKTTTMRCLTGYHPPTSGTVRVAGLDIVEDPRAAKERIGYLPEVPPLYPEMTVRAYLEFVAQLRGVPRQNLRAALDDVLEPLHLGPVRDRVIRNISKGYRQRVGLAQALIGRPPVVILDEPTVGLDPKQIIETRELIRSLAGRHTVILSSHILPEVQQVCQRVVIIDQGRLVAIDTPEGLARRLRRAQVLAVRVKGEASQVAAVLAAVPGVAQVTAEGGEPPLFQVEAQPGEDVREALFFALARAELPLLELRPVEFSLEEVFLRLTTAEAAADGAAGEAAGEPTGVAAGGASGSDQETAEVGERGA